MQSKLATWSTEDKERKFDRLLRLVADRDWLSEAARITLASSGARTPGVDGIGKVQMQDNLRTELATIRTELLAGSYNPRPARRVLIPKANGKMRPLGIPCLRDRIVQRAILMVMEPIWESDFHAASYGFRPARSVHHAIRTVKLQLQDGGAESTAGRWVIEGDLASYFDTVHHRLLMKAIRKRIADQRLLALLWKFIKAGCVDHGLFRAASEGVPQGFQHHVARVRCLDGDELPQQEGAQGPVGVELQHSQSAAHCRAGESAVDTGNIVLPLR
jgi:RNA-directed DNA polymerase